MSLPQAVPDTPRLRSRLPAAAIYCWPRPPITWAELAQTPLASAFLDLPGVLQVRPGVVAVLPTAGGPDIFDAAARGARQLLRAAGGRARVLIAPATCEPQPNGSLRWDDRLAHDLDQRPPALLWNAPHLTGHATQLLEGRFQEMPRGIYEAPSGQRVPLVRLGSARAMEDPRRNPRPLGRATKGVPRVALTERLQELLQQPALRVEGMLGVGKSRLVWEALQAGNAPTAWAVCGGSRAALGASLGEQLFALLLANPRRGIPGATAPSPLHSEPRPSLPRHTLVADPLFLALRIAAACAAVYSHSLAAVNLVIDSVERASPSELELISLLFDTPQFGRNYRLVLIGRTAATWPERTLELPVLEVPALGLSEAQQLCQRLTLGLSMPAETSQRLLDVTAGNPFALEEGLHELIHRQVLRRVYGSFFFSGEAATGFQPSNRWVCHVTAEASRLGNPAPLRALAVAQIAVPPRDLAAVALSYDESSAALEDDWHRPFLAAGWLNETETPWGPGVEFANPAFAAALAWTVPDHQGVPLRQEMGRVLAKSNSQGRAGWEAYRLLKGTPEALAPLLGAAHARPDDLDPGELIDALAAELRQAKASADRLEVLWQLLPLAHREGRLGSYRADLDGAIVLAARDSQKLLALRALRAELDESEGNLSEAEGDLRRALQTAIDKEGDADRKAVLSIRLGRVLMRDERYGEARRLFEEIRPLLERAGRSTLAASCDFYLGNIALQERRLDDAKAHHECALQTRSSKGMKAAAGISLSALGATALAAGSYAEALERFEASRKLLGDGGDPSFALLGAGRALDRMGDFAGASPLLRQALNLREGKAEAIGEAVARLAVAENQLHLDRVEVAHRELLQAHFLLSMTSPTRTLGDAEMMIGRVLLRQRQIEEAAARFLAAAAIHRESQDRAGLLSDLGWSLEAARLLGDERRVEELVSELSDALNAEPYPERGEIIDLQLFRALSWLNERGRRRSDALTFLRRAYENLVRKMSHLTAEHRNRFLLQVPSNREILQAATQHGVAASG